MASGNADLRATLDSSVAEVHRSSDGQPRKVWPRNVHLAELQCGMFQDDYANDNDVDDSATAERHISNDNDVGDEYFRRAADLPHLLQMLHIDQYHQSAQVGAAS